ncbi:ribonuclease h1 [Plakobranchus ocellatus]|uniref:Ribonuclease h1 n=1 Tax=Plakobranchus ocellatus TaxID=259542 RepID=A0AAV4ADX7_9GAST|nr:ribonuclease h1 [Plakobranchus ocellatus]
MGINNVIRNFPPYVHVSFVWIPAHVDIRGNEMVDKLANAATSRASSSEKLICWSDLKPKVNAYIHTIWQENWDAGANKLHEVPPNLGDLDSLYTVRHILIECPDFQNSSWKYFSVTGGLLKGIWRL